MAELWFVGSSWYNEWVSLYSRRGGGSKVPERNWTGKIHTKSENSLQKLTRPGGAPMENYTNLLSPSMYNAIHKVAKWKYEAVTAQVHGFVHEIRSDGTKAHYFSLPILLLTSLAWNISCTIVRKKSDCSAGVLCRKKSNYICYRSPFRLSQHPI